MFLGGCKYFSLLISACVCRTVRVVGMVGRLFLDRLTPSSACVWHAMGAVGRLTSSRRLVGLFLVIGWLLLGD